MTKTFTRVLLTLTLLATTFGASAELPAGYTLSPADGSKVTSISEFTVGCGWLNMKYGVSTADVLINGTAYTATLTQLSNEELKFTLNNSINRDGTYTMIIPENSFLVGWEDAPSPLLEFTYVVEGGTGDNGGGDQPDPTIQNIVPEGYQFTPAAGTEIPVLTSFAVEATDNMFLTPASRECKITINGEAIKAITTVSGEQHNVLTWTLADPINTPGNYTVYIPEGTFFGYDEVDNKPFIVTVVVTGGDIPAPNYFDGEVTSDPASGSIVTALGKIAIQYPKLTSAYVGPKALEIEVSNENGKIEAPYTLTPDPDSFNEAHVIWLEFATPITEPGNYTLQFPAQCFEIAKYPDSWYSAPFTLTFTVSDKGGISTITPDAPAGAAEYFTIDGVKVSTPTTSGIYIKRTNSTIEKIIIR